MESYFTFSRLARGRRARRGLPIAFAFLVRCTPPYPLPLFFHSSYASPFLPFLPPR